MKTRTCLPSGATGSRSRFPTKRYRRRPSGLPRSESLRRSTSHRPSASRSRCRRTQWPRRPSRREGVQPGGSEASSCAPGNAGGVPCTDASADAGSQRDLEHLAGPECATSRTAGSRGEHPGAQDRLQLRARVGRLFVETGEDVHGRVADPFALVDRAWTILRSRTQCAPGVGARDPLVTESPGNSTVTMRAATDRGCGFTRSRSNRASRSSSSTASASPRRGSRAGGRATTCRE
jgi:hypothetical protein